MTGHPSGAIAGALLAAIACATNSANAQSRVQLDAKPVLSIESESGGPETLFHQVQHVLRLPTSELLVVDGSTGELRFFSADGKFLRKSGRKGSGPAEFRNIAGVSIEGGSLRVMDATLQKIAEFSITGEFRSTLRLSVTGSDQHPLRMYRLAGFIAGGPILTANAFSADMKPVPTRHWDSIPNLAYDSAGKLRDTIGEFAGMDMYSTPEHSGDVKFGRASSSAVGGSHLYATDGGQMSIRKYDRSGKLVSTLRRALATRMVSKRDLDAYDQIFLARAAGDAERTKKLKAYLDSWPHAERKPWISRLVADDRGWVWAEQYAHWGDGSARTWTVFDERGSWAGDLTFPVGFQLMHVAGEFASGVTRDADGVESPSVFRVRRN
jgi:hypothetical protein